MTRPKREKNRVWAAAFAAAVLLLMPSIGHALCATVSIQIRQELTLERQAFDAHMRINNGLPHMAINNVGVTVAFTDEQGAPVIASSNPDDTDARFFIRVESMDNIENVDGAGVVAPETSADIHWLIIPAPGASNGLAAGALYYVGATLSYTTGGEEEIIEVTPDYIFVKPMPQLVLDYFVPADVYGDDPWTAAVEPPTPYSLGVRVRNTGYGVARALTIASAQPEIVDNQNGLLIAFTILGCRVNGEPAENSLLADFGDIAPHSAGTARWVMTSSLSGRFTAFDADFTHDDELGGQLTSLIAPGDVRTHFLVRDVLVDVSGRDAVQDFLAKDDDSYRVYESDNTDTLVTDQSANAVLTGQGALTVPATAGFMHAQTPDPHNGALVIKTVLRSDGKLIKSENAWLSKTRDGNGPWRHAIHIFDHDTPGAYTFIFQNPEDLPQAPVIMPIAEKISTEGQRISFIVEASDPNGVIPALTTGPLPAGAVFSDQADGRGVFDWTPAVGQAGRYGIRFIASDGVLESWRQASIIVRGVADTDGDGMPDAWEMEHFGALDRDGTGDFDGDGISDLDEFLNGLDPKTPQGAPSMPDIIAPVPGARTDQTAPALTIANSVDPEGDAFTYIFELYADKGFRQQLFAQAGITPDPGGVTAWTPASGLDDNHWYYWRVRALDATGSSNWAYGRFFVDTANDPPTAPVNAYPSDHVAVSARAPLLEIGNSQDVDGDDLTYRFEVYADSAMTLLAAAADGVEPGDKGRTRWTVDVPLEDGLSYYWRAIAVDERGGQTPGAPTALRIHTTNGSPTPPAILAPPDGAEINARQVDLTVGPASDPDGDELVCFFELDKTFRFTSPDRIASDPVSPMGDHTLWSVGDLDDNTLYHWRAKAGDGVGESPWAAGVFFVNQYNDAPEAPVLKNPANGAWVAAGAAALSVHPVSDIDNDTLAYRLEVYADQGLKQPAAFIEAAEPHWIIDPPLDAGQWYYWRAQAVDQHGVPGQWSPTGAFFAKPGGRNLPPQVTFVEPDGPILTNAQGLRVRWSDSDPDSNALISLYYDTDSSGADGVRIADAIAEDPDGAEDVHIWDVSALEGGFYLYAVIADEQSEVTAYCPHRIVLDRAAPILSASPAGGTYGGPVTVTLTADEAAVIYYTLDGGEPTIASAVYAEPLVLSHNTTLRVMAVDPAGNQSGIVTETYAFDAQRVTVRVSTDKGRMIAEAGVHAFTGDGRYTGLVAVTDSQGLAVFNPAAFGPGEYQFRVDYLGHRFWTQTVPLPDTALIPMVIAEEQAAVTIRTSAGPVAGVRVYLFDGDGVYLDRFAETDANGNVYFNLPVGVAFMFRTDLYGNQYWSEVVTIAAGDVNHLPVDTGGGSLRLVVEKAAGRPLSGLRVYLFHADGAYLDHFGETDETGAIDFNLPQGGYKCRVDYLGHQFWSAETEVETSTRATVAIAHQPVRVTVQSRFEDERRAVKNTRLYLFTPGGAYAGKYAQTDDQGSAVFDLPQQAFTVRADYQTRRFWSAPFTWRDPLITIPMAAVRVTVDSAGLALANTRVRAFSASDTDLDLSAVTNAQGQALFRLAAGGECKFRADHQGGRFWSRVIPLSADQLHDIGISTGGGAFQWQLRDNAGQPLGGVRCAVFDDAEQYLGLAGVTDAAGAARFDLAEGAYKLRAEYLGHHFWSGTIRVPDQSSAALSIAHSPVRVHVRAAGAPAPDQPVHLFTNDGRYQGRLVRTDAAGAADFSLPCAAVYTFRTDILERPYWSEPLTVPDQAAGATTIDAGGGALRLTVQTADNSVLPQTATYLFSESGTYLGKSVTTDAAGVAAYALPAGVYSLRIDYQGHPFWTDPITVNGDTSRVFTIARHTSPVSVRRVFQGAAEPLEGVRVHLFSDTGVCLGQESRTDSQGRAAFELTQNPYKIRIDYLQQHYWADTAGGQTATVAIPMAEARVSVTRAGWPRPGLRVYAFDPQGVYLGPSAVTDASGRALLRLPAGVYAFRADDQGVSYWSGAILLTADTQTPAVVSVGDGAFTLTARKDADTPLAGVLCRVLDPLGQYTGLSGATDAQGRVHFNPADGDYSFQIDYLGRLYRSETLNVPGASAHIMEIPHQEITVSLSGIFQTAREPLAGQPVRLFTVQDQDLGQHAITDDNGRARFSLPDQPYKIRADHLGGRYWSQPFRFQDTAIDIPQGRVDLHLSRQTMPVQGARIYLFTPQERYLGLYWQTGATGSAAFALPVGEYRFKVDAAGRQHWTPDVQVAADQTAEVNLTLE